MGKRKKIDMEMLIGLMDAHYSLTYVDYRENLNNNLDVIAKCFNANNCDVLFEDIDEWYYDQRDSSVIEVVKELKNMLLDIGYKECKVEKFFEENEDEIKDAIVERDTSEPIKDLLRNTGKIPVRIELISNFDCINSHFFESSGGYSYENSYFGDMIDALNLNPCIVRRLLLEKGVKIFGKFPNKQSRNGKEQVSYEQFFVEIENSCCGANLLTYIATVDIKELYNANFDLSEIIIPKGNSCGLFSSMQGGGSMMDMELKVDVKIDIAKAKNDYPYFRIEIEPQGKNFDYSIKQVYGVLDSFYGKPLSIVTQIQQSA